MEPTDLTELALQAGAQSSRRFWRLLTLLETKGLLTADEVSEVLAEPE